MMHSYPPVRLESRCRRDISARDRERGYAYFRQGRVRLSHLLPTAALAVVEGTEDYFVAVEGEVADRGILQVMCSCPRFEDGETCKRNRFKLAEYLAVDAMPPAPDEYPPPELNPNRGCDEHGIPLDPDHPWRRDS